MLVKIKIILFKVEEKLYTALKKKKKLWINHYSKDRKQYELEYIK